MRLAGLLLSGSSELLHGFPLALGSRETRNDRAAQNTSKGVPKPAQIVSLLCSGWQSITLDTPRPESSLVILQASGTLLFYLHFIWFLETRSHVAKADRELAM